MIPDMNPSASLNRPCFLAVAAGLLLGISLLGSVPARAAEARPPNVVLVLVDNLGWGELGCYGGGGLRGAPTPRLDRLAGEGLRLTNFNVETECVPSRSSLMTGRHPLRSGTLRSAPPGQPQGLVGWEVTLAEILSARGYATGHFGKWHLGDREGRFPTDQGFDEWFGIPRTSSEAFYTTAAGFDPRLAPVPHILEGRRGGGTREVAVFDLASRSRLDGELTRRALGFIEANARARRPFFAYVPLTQVHFPTLPHPDFKGRTGLGDFADAVVEMDHRVGELIDGVRAAGIAEETVFIFASDNGPEFRRPWQGFAGPWQSHYHSALEGGIRAPCIIRWPGRISPGTVTNAIVHISDLFTTLAAMTGAPIPQDRPIDGVDQTALLTGRQTESSREGLLVYIDGELHAAKWRNWKLHYWWQLPPPSGKDTLGAIKLEVPYLFNLLSDPHEDTDVRTVNPWVMVPINRLITEFQASLRRHPAIPPGTPDPYVPPASPGPAAGR